MTFNTVVERFQHQYLNRPNSIAIEYKEHPFFSNQYKSITFKEVWEYSNFYLEKLHQSNLQAGDKVLVFLKPQLTFTSVILSLFRQKLIPVFIDPGMGKENLLKSIEQIKPKGLIAEPIVFLLKKLSPKTFSSVQFQLINFPSKVRLRKSHFKEEKILGAGDPAAILFTSGGTGKPKGVLYTHAMFNQQTSMLQEMFKLNPNDIDLPGFPLFGMFTQAMGIKNVIPNLNPSKPSQLNPRRVVQNIIEKKVTFAAGSPAIWQKVSEYCIQKKITLPSLKTLVMFGAPVSIDLHQNLKKILPNGETFTPYGATECLPISLISGSDVLHTFKDKMNHGAGTCVGKIISPQKVRIIPVQNNSIETLPTSLEPDQIGEIIVSGPTMSREYVEMPEQTKHSKISNDDEIWHRMGDLGYFDLDDNLWFCGRKAHSFLIGNLRVCSTPIENIYNTHPKIKRSALIKLQDDSLNQIGIVIIFNEPMTKKELLAYSKEFKQTKEIINFFKIKSFPVDVRHNIKIDRQKLSRMAHEGKIQCIF